MNNLDHFIKENIPDDVVWAEKIKNLVRLAYELGKKHKERE